MEERAEKAAALDRSKRFGTYIFILVIFFAVQFGHGSNIGVAVSLPGDSKAMNLAMGSWVMVGVCLGLPLTPWASRTFGAFRLCSICVSIDFALILLMLWPNITVRQIYTIRFLVGFFEAPLLPYLQEWLSRFGEHHWNVWNTVLHAMVPLGENMGFIIALELTEVGLHWQWAFAGQALVLALTCCLVVAYGGRKYLDFSHSTCGKKPTAAHENDRNMPHVDERSDSTVKYPMTERWGVFWLTNASLAAQLGFMSGCRYVIRDYALMHGYSMHCALFSFSAIALGGPALGGAVAMSGGVVQPDQWSQHRRTLFFLVGASVTAACFASVLPVAPAYFFWPLMMAAFLAAGGVYPAAQGIINIALTRSRVIEASAYQVQCNNLLFAMPMPFAIGKSMDVWGVETSFHCVVLIQVLVAIGFSTAWATAACTDESRSWKGRFGEKRLLMDGDWLVYFHLPEAVSAATRAKVAVAESGTLLLPDIRV